MRRAAARRFYSYGGRPRKFLVAYHLERPGNRRYDIHRFELPTIENQPFPDHYQQIAYGSTLLLLAIGNVISFVSSEGIWW